MFGATMGSCVICRSHGRALSAFDLLPRFEEAFSFTCFACFFSARFSRFASFAGFALLGFAGFSRFFDFVGFCLGKLDPRNQSANTTGSRARLARAAHDIFEGRELLHPDWTARMKPAGGDADLCAHAELAAIRELGRSVVQHNCAVDAGKEFLRLDAILSDDGLCEDRVEAEKILAR